MAFAAPRSPSYQEFRLIVCYILGDQIIDQSKSSKMEMLLIPTLRGFVLEISYCYRKMKFAPVMRFYCLLVMSPTRQALFDK